MVSRVVSQALTRLFLLAVAITLLACSMTSSPPVQISRPALGHLRVTKSYHADVRFDDNERNQIDYAIALLNDQMNGVAVFEVVYDLEWDPEVGANVLGQDLIVATTSKSSETQVTDGEVEKGNVALGWCDLRFSNPFYSTTIFLVRDRLKRRQVFMHVTMHEMMHSIRLRHVQGRKHSVLFWQTDGPEPSLCMSRYDAEELCRVHRCRVEEISYCE